MAADPLQDAPELFGLFIIFLVLVVVLVVSILIILVRIFFVFLEVVLLVFFFDVLGDRIQSHRMGLRNLQLGLALRARQDLALFHVVFVHIKFCGTIWTAKHGSNLQFDLYATKPGEARSLHPAYYISRNGKSMSTLA